MQTVSERRLNIGLLIMRLGMAASLLVYALPKLIGGTQMWIHVGKGLRFLQADLSAQVVGCTLLIIETLASLGLITGAFFRISAVMLASVYSLYFISFMSRGYQTLPLYAAALACVCVSYLFTGPGRFVVAVKIEQK